MKHEHVLRPDGDFGEPFELPGELWRTLENLSSLAEAGYSANSPDSPSSPSKNMTLRQIKNKKLKIKVLDMNISPYVPSVGDRVEIADPGYETAAELISYDFMIVRQLFYWDDRLFAIGHWVLSGKKREYPASKLRLAEIPF